MCRRRRASKWAWGSMHPHSDAAEALLRRRSSELQMRSVEKRAALGLSVKLIARFSQGVLVSRNAKTASASAVTASSAASSSSAIAEPEACI